MAEKKPVAELDPQLVLSSVMIISLSLSCLGWYCGAGWIGIHRKVDQEGRDSYTRVVTASRADPKSR